MFGMGEHTDSFRTAALGIALTLGSPAVAQEQTPETTRPAVVQSHPEFNVRARQVCPVGLTCEGGSYVLQPADVASRNVTMGVGYFRGERSTAPNDQQPNFRLNEPKPPKGVVGVGIRVRF